MTAARKRRFSIPSPGERVGRARAMPPEIRDPVQRTWQDLNAVARQVSLNWDADGAIYGQHAFGLDPRGQY